MAAKRLGFNKDALDCRFFLPDAPFKTINRRFKLGDAKIGTKLDGSREQHLIYPQLHGEQISDRLDSRF